MDNTPNFKNQPDNQNIAQPTRFQMVFARLPTFTFFCQSVILPSVSTNYVPNPTPFVDQKLPGDKLYYSPVSVVMVVDEDLRAFREIHDWMRAYTFPTDFKEYRSLPDQIRAGRNMTNRPQYSDMYINIFNNNWQRIMTWKFMDAFPTSLGELSYNASDSPQTTMIIDVTFEYQWFDIEAVQSA